MNFGYYSIIIYCPHNNGYNEQCIILAAKALYHKKQLIIMQESDPFVYWQNLSTQE